MKPQSTKVTFTERVAGQFHHAGIIVLGEKLGYFQKQRETGTSGVCQGFIRKWSEAELLGDSDIFENRIDRIFNPSTLLQVEELKSKLVNNKNYSMTKDEEEILDILAFYENLDLFQNPHLYNELFNQAVIPLEIEKISKIASSDKTLEQGGLATIYKDIGLYTSDSYATYLKNMENVFKSTCTEGTIIAINLSNHNHAVGLSYKVGTGWKFRDANQTYPFSTTNPQELGSRIAAGLMYNRSEKLQTIDTKVILMGNNPQLKQLASNLKANQQSLDIKLPIQETLAQSLLNVVSREKAGTPIKYLYRLLKMAAMNGHAHIISDLAKYNLDFNTTAGEPRVTPLMLASAAGQIEVVKQLTQKVMHVDVNKAVGGGITAAFYAAYCGRTDTLKVLLNTPDYKSTPLYIYVFDQHPSRSIGPLNSELDDKLHAFAARADLVEGGLLGYLGYKVRVFPEDIAKIMGHQDCVNLFKPQTQKETPVEKKAVTNKYRSQMQERKTVKNESCTILTPEQLNRIDEHIRILNVEMKTLNSETSKAIKAEHIESLKAFKKLAQTMDIPEVMNVIRTDNQFKHVNAESRTYALMESLKNESIVTKGLQKKQ